MKTKCMITGVILFVGDSEAFHADLFVQGETCIFNANQHDVLEDYRGLVARSRTERTGVKFAYIPPPHEYFERRGVYVAHESDVLLSVEALEYMERQP